MPNQRLRYRANGWIWLLLVFVSLGCFVNLGLAQEAVNQDANVDSRDSHDSQLSKFSEDVILHVVLHEMGHALIREFDLPVLGNEETVADAFATHYLTTYLPDRAVDVLKARTASLMIEADEVPRAEWTIRGEHNNDARRAYQIAALAVAADAEKYGSLARDIGMSDSDINNGKDYGAEIHRSWRRTLQPLWMVNGGTSTEARVKCESEGKIVSQLASSTLVKELETALKRFDWHSQVTIHFVEGDGGAGWSRSKRTITVNSEYVQRFIQQGQTAGADPGTHSAGRNSTK